jgi:hypothetical protein
MRRFLKFTGIGCLGLIVVVVIIGVIAVATARPVKTPQGSDPPQQQPEEPQPAEQPSALEDYLEQPSGLEDYLEVTGTEGIPFSCAVMDGDMSQSTVDGTVPQKIPLKEMGWTATSENSCQKSGTEGTLKVAIVVGGEVQDTNSTSAAYGAVSVGYP